ncbi:hypothetical protein RFI_26005, partial [Reticulomyxa filosa]
MLGQKSLLFLSYILKNEYKLICEYPSDVQLVGHCVIKLVDNNNKYSNQITLLSFGGARNTKRHTLMMKYESVWSNISNKLKKSNNCNQWIPFTNNDNHPIIIGTDKNNYCGARAVIGGSNNHLFVFNLNLFKFIQHDTLSDTIQYHGFILKSKNEQEQEKNSQNYEMLLFGKEVLLSIEYDEYNNTFQVQQPIRCIRSFNRCAYACVSDTILFFGGWNIGQNSGRNIGWNSGRNGRWNS